MIPHPMSPAEPSEEAEEAERSGPGPVGRITASRTKPTLAEHRRLSLQAWESLFQAQVAVMRLLRENPVFRQLSMREYDVLYTLSRCPGGWLRLHELNHHVLLTQPSISRLVDRLEAQGFVQRKVAEGDRRGVLIGLTEAGLQLQRALGQEHVKDIHQLLGSALTPAELRQLTELTEKLRDSVQNGP